MTGASGTIGAVLSRAWPAGELEPFDLPRGDARDRAALTEAARGHGAIVHLAWDGQRENYLSGEVSPDNVPMAVNALKAAVSAGVPRVVLASSVHANRFWPKPAAEIQPGATPVPDSPYGASKVFMEALGRHFASYHDLEVVAIRFGGVNREDRIPDNPADRLVWLPHADCISLVKAALTEPIGPNRFALVIGVGDMPDRVHAFSDDLAWRPAPRP